MVGDAAFEALAFFFVLGEAGVVDAVVAGGGFKGGQVVGASDARGEDVADRPVYPSDLLSSIYELVGIDPEGPLPNPRNLDVRVLPSGDDTKSGGRLTELMQA